MKKKATTIITADALIKALKDIPPKTEVYVIARLNNGEVIRLPVCETGLGSMHDRKLVFAISFKAEHFIKGIGL